MALLTAGVVGDIQDPIRGHRRDHDLYKDNHPQEDQVRSRLSHIGYIQQLAVLMAGVVGVILDPIHGHRRDHDLHKDNQPQEDQARNPLWHIG